MKIVKEYVLGQRILEFFCAIAMKSRKYQAGVVDADMEETIRTNLRKKHQDSPSLNA
jgi:hypothetical protein